jgi:hypothetical protein
VDALDGWYARRTDPGHTYVRDGHEVVRLIDAATRQLYHVRAVLGGEIRADEDERAVRVDRLLADRRAERADPPTDRTDPGTGREGPRARPADQPGRTCPPTWPEPVPAAGTSSASMGPWPGTSGAFTMGAR